MMSQGVARSLICFTALHPDWALLVFSCMIGFAAKGAADPCILTPQTQLYKSLLVSVFIGSAVSMTGQQTRRCFIGQLMREVEVSNLPGKIITAVQCCSMQHNQYQLIVSSQTQGQMTCLQVDDAVASQAVLADILAAMQVQTAGQSCNSCTIAC